jgi:hypothetical protein
MSGRSARRAEVIGRWILLMFIASWIQATWGASTVDSDLPAAISARRRASPPDRSAEAAREHMELMSTHVPGQLEVDGLNDSTGNSMEEPGPVSGGPRIRPVLVRDCSGCWRLAVCS